MQNRCVVLKSRAIGIPQPADFALEERTLAPLADGQLLVRNAYLSVEPAMRGWIADTQNYSAPVEIGAVMRSLAAGTVIASRHPDWHEGDLVTGWFGWQELAAVEPTAIIRRITETDLDLSLSLGVLGINGVTAHIGLNRIGMPVAGDTVVVSTAAGAGGSVVGQLAHVLGGRTGGITRGPEKVKLCRELFGYDAAIDYRNEDVATALAAACPSGVNVYFDSTSGAISDAVMAQLAMRARVVVCGTASIGAWSPWPTGPRVERHLLVKRARMEGFVIFDHLDLWDETVAALADRVRAGSLRYREHVIDGLENAPDALAGLYRGDNLGKTLIRL
mgnify:CR=1 FL=1